MKKYIEVRGQTYAVAVTGNGPPLMSLHGFSGTKASLSRLHRELETNFTVIAVDLPGHGETNAPKVTSMDQACTDLAVIQEALGFKKADWLGYSMGGRIALSMAVHKPECVRRLILIGASPGLEGEIRNERQAADNDLADWIKCEGIDAFVAYWEELPLFQSQKSRLDEGAFHAQRNERRSQTPRGLAQSLKTMGTGAMPPLWHRLEAVTHPVLLTAGEEDEKFCAIQHKMAARLPRAAEVIVSGAGHAAHLEQPKALADEIQQFLL
ncbi:2-succinyl-6-hydroxy-2,4-cyclohexadiene-1-carboxylate synthase [Salsuginibacillus halophilus]|uniref:Putative 2-succinyl-6-hydroxy-2,4-cyclohexadiene-1-carboxylate synthase n=1 Tax=Salsuginibacillus halophilus TaxID=517424 RepID=A0A2P8HWB8_9BACI|nr:2-succinyl-6-hydroxy-2,4-cyclohexadiene-1-carboxylate synthase [Salsuginibacillus halophilus]PSL50519.1 2-succinyl-6-hydroxy-2,4-cyclohexadiene-1-carboxylate synthase [Salsuginibacillus halophilus]